MADFPRGLKHVTVWLLAGTAVFLLIQTWQAQGRAARFAVADGVITLQRGPDGHFHWPGTVNGRPVEFLVDTGATRTALPAALVPGLAAEAQVRSRTAGGDVTGYIVRVDLALQGGVAAERWPVTVLPTLAQPLLGMDVLGKLQFSQRGGTLELQQPARP